MEPAWLDWARRLNALAQSGLTYAESPYDIERYTAIRTIAAEMIAHGSGADTSRVLELFDCDAGYATPKVDVRGVVFLSACGTWHGLHRLVSRRVLLHSREISTSSLATGREEPSLSHFNYNRDTLPCGGASVRLALDRLLEVSQRFFRRVWHSPAMVVDQHIVGRSRAQAKWTGRIRSRVVLLAGHQPRCSACVLRLRDSLCWLLRRSEGKGAWLTRDSSRPSTRCAAHVHESEDDPAEMLVRSTGGRLTGPCKLRGTTMRNRREAHCHHSSFDLLDQRAAPTTVAIGGGLLHFLDTLPAHAGQRAGQPSCRKARQHFGPRRCPDGSAPSPRRSVGCSGRSQEEETATQGHTWSTRTCRTAGYAGAPRTAGCAGAPRTTRARGPQGTQGPGGAQGAPGPSGVVIPYNLFGGATSAPIKVATDTPIFIIANNTINGDRGTANMSLEATTNSTLGPFLEWSGVNSTSFPGFNTPPTLTGGLSGVAGTKMLTIDVFQDVTLQVVDGNHFAVHNARRGPKPDTSGCSRLQALLERRLASPIFW